MFSFHPEAWGNGPILTSIFFRWVETAEGLRLLLQFDMQPVNPDKKESAKEMEINSSSKITVFPCINFRKLGRSKRFWNFQK